MTKLRKFFASSVMVMTVVVMSGLTAPMATKAAASAGDLIKKDGLSAVYYLGEDGKRYVFPNEATYKSWYSDFSGVVTVSADELASYPLGANVVVRPGTKLVKITTDPKVYAVEANGTLRWVQTEADAIALYGANWAQRVIDVADSFFTNYTIGTPLASNEVPAGSLVKKSGENNIYYFDGSNYRLIEDEVAFLANRFQHANVLTLNNFTPGGSTITGAEASIVKTSQAVTGPVITGSGITVSLNSMTPASTSVMATQALVPFTTINLTAANDGSITVRSIKLKRTGISSDSAVSNVYLYEGNTRLTDASSLSNGYVNFSTSNLITIPAGQTKTLTVKVDMASSNSGGNLGFAVESASDVVSTGASVSGSFPISGNLMSLLGAQSDLAAIALSAGTMASSPIKAGNSNMIVWSANTSVTKKAVDFKYLALKQVGSINNDDLTNLSLYVDGTKVSTGALTSNNDLVFDLTSAPSRLNIGSHTIELKADIVKGSSRTFNFQMQTVANVVFTDTNYGVNIAPNGAVSGTAYTISPGSVTTASDSSFTATEVVKTASNVSLGKFTMKAWGEDVKINTLAATVNFTGTSSATVTEGLNDLAIFVDGNQVGSSQTINLATGTANAAISKSFGTTNLFTISAGKTVVVEIKGSLNLDTATTSLITGIKASLGVGAGQGVTSYTSVNTTGVDGKTLSIVTGSLSVAKNGSMQNMNVAKNTKVRLGSYILSAGSAEGVTVSNIRVGVNATTTVLDNMSNLYISENTTPVQPQAANDFNVNLVIDKNATKVIDVWANLGDIADNLQASTTLVVTYRTNATLTNGTTNSIEGQTITLKSASLNEDPTIVANTPAGGFVLGGSTGTIGNYKFVATNGNARITEMTFTASTTFAGIGRVIVDGVETPVVNGLVTVTGLNKEILAGNQGTNVEVKAVYNNVTSDGQGGVDTGKNVSLTLNGFKYNVGGVQTVVTGKNISTVSMRLVSAYPNVVNATVSNDTEGTLTATAKTEVMRFTVTATGNNGINLKTIGLKANYDYNCGASSSRKVYIEDASVSGTNLATSTAVYGATTGTSSVITLDSAIEIAAGQTKTFVVYVDNSGTTVSGNYFRMDVVNAGWTWNDGTITTYTIDGTHIKEFTGRTFKK